MTENEAIEWLERLKRMYRAYPNAVIEAWDIAIKALEEIQQYHSIGTVEECQEAMERQRAKKPVKDEYNHDCCPNCGWIVYKNEYGGRYLPHCENCGQAIDWSD